MDIERLAKIWEALDPLTPGLKLALLVFIAAVFGAGYFAGKFMTRNAVERVEAQIVGLQNTIDFLQRKIEERPQENATLAEKDKYLHELKEIIEKLQTNETSTPVAPMFFFAPYLITVPKDTPAGSTIFRPFGISLNGLAVGYRIISGADPGFAIDARTGEITLRHPMPYAETRKLVLEVSDSRTPPLSTRADMTVKIVDPQGQ